MDQLPIELQDYIFAKTDIRTCLANGRMYAANQIAKTMSLTEHLTCLKTSPDPTYFNWLYHCDDFCHKVLYRRLVPTRMAYILLKRCMMKKCHTFAPQMVARTWGKWGTLSEIEAFLQEGHPFVDDLLDGACLRRDALDIFNSVPCTESGVMSLILTGNVHILANVSLPYLDNFAKSIGSIRAVESRSIAMIAYVLDILAFPKMSDMYIYCYGDLVVLRFLYLKKVPLPVASEVIRYCSVDVMQELLLYGMVLDEACFARCTNDYDKLLFLQRNMCPFPDSLFVQYYIKDPRINLLLADKPIVYTYFYWHDMIRAMKREPINEDLLFEFLFSDENDEEKLFHTVGKYASLSFITRCHKHGLTSGQRYEIARGTSRLNVLDLMWPFELQPALLTQALMYEKWDIMHWLLRKGCPIDTLVLQEVEFKGDARLKKICCKSQDEPQPV